MLRGNSGSGKSTVARALQLRYDRTQTALIAQDNILREPDTAHAFPHRVARAHGHHVLNRQAAGHRGRNPRRRPLRRGVAADRRPRAASVVLRLGPRHHHRPHTRRLDHPSRSTRRCAPPSSGPAW
ncbi:hypothetical protein [Nocardia rhamnosiphila]|uniref:Uncharacterized protein n=1 Tax=Nocardia rhamnosiphila TaxID=426716 RepID=A0ABV2WXK9_9NOCA